MASERMIQRGKKLIKLITDEKKQNKRNELRSFIKDKNNSQADKLSALTKLQKLPRDENPVRSVRRCQSCGRPKGVFRRFGLCRLCLRKFGSMGWIPGLNKSSW